MRIRFSVAFAVLTLLAQAACSREEPTVYDLVIEGGTVVDGNGSPGRLADMAIQGDAIAAIGQIPDSEKSAAKRRIDAAGLVVSPGFIDIHTHSDYSLLYDGTGQSKIRQGVTTEILGESLSAGPIKGRAPTDLPYGLTADWETLGGYLDRLERQGVSMNVGSFVGATQVRLCVLGEDSRDPSEEEMEEMLSLVREAMDEGAFGLSTALLVPPNTYHTLDQLAAMASVVKPYGGIYFTHIRSEGIGIEDAIREAIEVGERAQVPVDILHFKIADRQLWGRMPEVCGIIEEARQRGLEVTANLYPYVAGQNNLNALIPPWAMEGGRPKMMERLQDRAARHRMARDILQGLPDWFDHYLAAGSWEGCVIASVGREENKPLEGKSVAEAAQATGKEPTEVVFDLLLSEGGSVPAVYFLMSEEDVKYAMARPWVSFGSDGSAVRPDGVLGEGKPHPRWYGTFPRILGKYVREEGVLPLEEAIAKMTSLNARKLGIPDRGELVEGWKADVTVFDADRVIDRARFGDPHHYPEGIEYVIVNGAVVLDQGEHNGALPGRILRK